MFLTVPAVVNTLDSGNALKRNYDSKYYELHKLEISEKRKLRYRNKKKKSF